MPILNLNHVSLYYEEFGQGDRYLIQAQQFVNSHIYYTKDLADRCGFHAFIIRIRGYAPSSMVTEDLGDDWYDVWAQDVVDFADAMGIEKFFLHRPLPRCRHWLASVHEPPGPPAGLFCQREWSPSQGRQANRLCPHGHHQRSEKPGDLGPLCGKAGLLLCQGVCSSGV